MLTDEEYIQILLDGASSNTPLRTTVTKVRSSDTSSQPCQKYMADPDDHKDKKKIRDVQRVNSSEDTLQGNLSEEWTPTVAI